jgi:hypothetical protein
MTDSAHLHEQFERDGFVIVDDVLDRQRDLLPILNDYAEHLDALARSWHAKGALSSTFEDLPFNQRAAAGKAFNNPTAPKCLFISCVRQIRLSASQGGESAARTFGDQHRRAIADDFDQTLTCKNSALST